MPFLEWVEGNKDREPHESTPGLPYRESKISFAHKGLSDHMNKQDVREEEKGSPGLV